MQHAHVLYSNSRANIGTVCMGQTITDFKDIP